jgi:hypothetical protein
MIDQLQKILPENKIEDFLSISRGKSIYASDYFIKAGQVPKKLPLLFQVYSDMYT